MNEFILCDEVDLSAGVVVCTETLELYQSPIFGVMVTVAWLKSNMPSNEFELDRLMEMIVDAFHNGESSESGYYSVWKGSEETMVLCGPISNICVPIERIDYVLELLDGLKDEMRGEYFEVIKINQ